MKTISFHVLRIGIAITFFWIGILIFQDPEGWGLYLQPWAVNLLPIPVKTVMVATAFLDMSIGIFLFINVLTWFTALLGFFHLFVVLITSGINEITVRDIGLLSATLALAVNVWPKSLRFWNKN